MELESLLLSDEICFFLFSGIRGWIKIDDVGD